MLISENEFLILRNYFLISRNSFLILESRGILAIYGPIGHPHKFNRPQVSFGLNNFFGGLIGPYTCHMTLSIINYLLNIRNSFSNIEN